LEPAQRAELVDTVCVEAARLERFVANLLEMTRLQAGALEVKREWVPLEVVVNLLDNALKHTPPGTEVEVAARAGEGGVWLEVSDRGPGLPPGAEERV